MSSTGYSWLAWRLPVFVVVSVLAVRFIGFRAGRESAIHRETTGCLSAKGSISCTLDDGWDVKVPLDVEWTDDSGALNDGRPGCLPPTGIGLEGPVELTWVDIEVDDRQSRHVVAVKC